MFKSKMAILLLFHFSLAQASYLSEVCTTVGGELVMNWTCPSSQELREGEFCVLKNGDGTENVFNGCTGAKGHYAQLFFKACTSHDFCYHHEPNSSGKTKKECDQQLLQDTLAICANQPDRETRCNMVARAFYTAVATMGNSSWNCSKTESRYQDVLFYF